MFSHKPVLLGETIDFLKLKKGDVVVDATLGSGGHSRKILEKIGQEGVFIGIDLDAASIENFKSQVSSLKLQIKTKLMPGAEKIGNTYLVNGNFSKLGSILIGLKVGKVDAILADLGWRTDQIENEKYGLSFQKESLLDMRLGKTEANDEASLELTAEKIVNEWPEKELARIFKEYGEERHASLVARVISQSRKLKRISYTTDLAQIITKAIGSKYRNLKIHPATRIFQALRIVVNNEIDNLEKFLPQALEGLKKGGRMAIISFHSLEDRRVKNFFRTNAGGCVCPKEFPVCVCDNKPKLKIVTKKPITPTPDELMDNPRARSAKLRIAEKL